jgi:hypothetical protein
VPTDTSVLLSFRLNSYPKIKTDVVKHTWESILLPRIVGRFQIASQNATARAGSLLSSGLQFAARELAVCVLPLFVKLHLKLKFKLVRLI